MKKQNGKLLDTKVVPVTNSDQICYTCKFHDWRKDTPATLARVRTFENVVHKTYFCDEHRENASK